MAFTGRALKRVLGGFTMNFRKAAVGLVLSCFAFQVTAGESTLPTAIRSTIEASVTQDTASGVFSYSYRVVNPPTSTGQIRFVTVDVSLPSGGETLGSDGLVNGPRIDRQAYYERLVKVQTVPLALSAPNRWIGARTMYGEASWGSSGPETRILPGTSLSGFQIRSHGVPTLRTAKLEPFYPYAREEWSKTVIGEYETRAQAEAVAHVATIGPTAPPKVFVPANYVNEIIRLKEQARSLGWIKNDGLLRSFDAELDAARKALVRGQVKAACNELYAFLNELEAKHTKGVSQEAYALLRFNVEFLLKKINSK